MMIIWKYCIILYLQGMLTILPNFKEASVSLVSNQRNDKDAIDWLCPQIGQQYGLKNKAAIAFTM